MTQSEKIARLKAQVRQLREIIRQFKALVAELEKSKKGGIVMKGSQFFVGIAILAISAVAQIKGQTDVAWAALIIANIWLVSAINGAAK